MHKLIFKHIKPTGERPIGFQQVFYIPDQPSFVKSEIKEQSHAKAGKVWQRNEYRYKLDLIAHEPLLDALTYLPMYSFVWFHHDVVGLRRCTDITFNVTWSNHIARIELEFCVDAVITGTCEVPMANTGKAEQPGWNNIVEYDKIILRSSLEYSDPWNNGIEQGMKCIVYDSIDGNNLIGVDFHELKVPHGWFLKTMYKGYLYASDTDGTWAYNGATCEPLAVIDSLGTVGLNSYLIGNAVAGMFLTLEYSSDSGTTWGVALSPFTTTGEFSLPISILTPGTQYRCKLWIHGAIYGYSETFIIS